MTSSRPSSASAPISSNPVWLGCASHRASQSGAVAGHDQGLRSRRQHVPARRDLLPWQGKPMTSAATTMMIQNIPRSTAQNEVMAELERCGFSEMCNFLYMPSALDKQARRGMGYAFVDFKSAECAARFLASWDKSQRFGMAGRNKLSVQPAKKQGVHANFRSWHTGKTRRIRNPCYMPMVHKDCTAPDSGARRAPSGSQDAAPASPNVVRNRTVLLGTTPQQGPSVLPVEQPQFISPAVAALEETVALLDGPPGLPKARATPWSKVPSVGKPVPPHGDFMPDAAAARTQPDHWFWSQPIFDSHDNAALATAKTRTMLASTAQALATTPEDIRGNEFGILMSTPQFRKSDLVTVCPPPGLEQVVTPFEMPPKMTQFPAATTPCAARESSKLSCASNTSVESTASGKSTPEILMHASLTSAMPRLASS